MKYAGIDEATPELSRDALRPGAGGRFGWLQDVSSRIALATALGTAVVTIVLWLARVGHPRADRTRAGGHLNIVRCPEHGIAYDAELEECTECAKAATSPSGRPRHLAAVPSTPEAPGLRPLPKSVE